MQESESERHSRQFISIKGVVAAATAAGTAARGGDNVLHVEFCYVHHQTFISFFIHIHARPFRLTKVSVRRLIVPIQRLREVRVVGISRVCQNLCVIERGVTEGFAAYGEGLQGIEL